MSDNPRVDGFDRRSLLRKAAVLGGALLTGIGILEATRHENEEQKRAGKMLGNPFEKKHDFVVKDNGDSSVKSAGLAVRKIPDASQHTPVLYRLPEGTKILRAVKYPGGKNPDDPEFLKGGWVAFVDSQNTVVFAAEKYLQEVSIQAPLANE